MDAKSLFSQAYQAQQTGQLTHAISLYNQVLRHEPKHIDALRFSGLAHAQNREMPYAIACFTQALDLQPDDANLHNNLANAYKSLKNDDKAIEHYQKALQLAPNYAQAHNNLASIYALQNHYHQALKHYRAAVHAQPDFAAAHYNLGLLLMSHHELAAARKQFTNVLALQPENVDAQFYLGVLHLDANLFDEAETAFQNVLAIREEHVFSLTNLGVIALKREQGQLAIDYFTKALAFEPDNIEARNNIAATFIHHDRYENALMHYDVLLKQDPHNAEYLYNSGVAQMALGHLQEAMAHFKTILACDEDHFAALNNLAAIQIRLGHRTEAITLLQRAIAANPKDTASQFMLHALTGDEKHPAPCPDYVSNLFNNYALYYDQHMQGALKYTLPFAIMQALLSLGYTAFNQTLDLGCGTGLSGVALRESSAHLTGLDIATKMLAQAREKAVYDELVEAELLVYLQQNTRQYDLLVAADVLPYSGDLQPLFAIINLRLTEDGLFVFSSEISANQPWALQYSARFCHHPDYIQALCDEHGLQLVYQEKIVARQQDGQDLFVMLYVARKSSRTRLRDDGREMLPSTVREPEGRQPGTPVIDVCSGFEVLRCIPERTVI